ncbi:TR_FER [Nesidiocoris tenuis]|uniref:TR_FER n=1 Tax=Nesidiocoris tenuis TaxID=355587 RepID=A0ABN7AGW1_9HEMI|nr:TR_FER [Nesidiocoris tenuis]
MDSTSCKRVEEGNSQVSCVQVTDSVDCSNKLRDGTADFALYSADDAILAGKKVGTSLNVIGEARYRGRFNEPNDEELVAVVRKSFSGFFSDLLGKGYCHPGVGISYKFNDMLLKSFERKVVTKRECTSTYSAAEQEIRELEMFFGPSCRPGAWAVDDNLDNKLKRRYRNMCRLCESPQQCSNGMLNSGLTKGALDCLVINGGDVAFVSLAAVESYFGLSKGQASASVADYAFLCPNQTMMPINISGRPCIWASQPWDLFVTRNSVSSDLQSKLSGWLSDTKKDGPDRWQTSLRKLLLKDQRVFVTRPLNNTLPIGQYINRGVADEDSRSCQRRIEWCTTNDLEKEKCSWLSAATRTFGMNPSVECSTTADNKWKCLRKIAERKANIVSIPTDDGYIARKVYNLSTVFFEDNLLGANYKIIAVLKAQSSATSFKDLKNRKACFPEYNGLAWLGFTNAVRQQGLLGKKCPESYFSEACAPGAQSEEFSPNGKRAPSTLCNLCPPSDGGSCSPNLSRTERNLRALQCLDNNGDVAFINVRAISTGSSNIQINSSIDQTKYRVLCSNGTIANGVLDVDENCALGTGVQGEIMARGNRDNVEESDAKELLLSLNKWFGMSDDRAKNTISIYDKFRGQGGILFEENAISLVDPDDEFYIYVNNYRSLLQNASQSCNQGTVSVSSTSVMGWISIVTIIVWYGV